ncbi:MDR family MFS transporter [Paenibacillus eucommiae]|uniref:EmrB/QacA subfamily drug resistance transporter n=1 Tax=Paenibacillus eucommiae TaxID=1355755 RepID=A0ABS4J899_9BACL|nr:MDR family MFS transporter [Paenibacillus eucommiae]MBP1996069.1 EmrB/QacA subfamily drug resistance transporter [Paenibacillus eucommiae]
MHEQAAAKPDTFSLKAILPTLLAIAIGMFVVMLDGTIMNVAIPKLVNEFDTSLQHIQWVITCYTLALSAVIPLAGWFSDRFSAKRMFLFSIVMFVIGSVLCSLAQTADQLIVFRIIQGLGGGMVAPIGIAMTFTLAPPEKRGAIMGVMGAPMLLAPILGPVLSGWLIDYVNWQWIFLINVPVGIIAFVMGRKYLRPSNPSKQMKLDIKGALLAPIAFGSLVFAVHEGGTNGWGSVVTISTLVIGLIALILFIFVELKQKQPLLELRAFRSGSFTLGITLSWVNMVALFGSILLFSLYLQQVKGLSAFDAGLMVIPQAILSTIGIIVGGKLFDKFGIRPVAIIGVASTACSLFAMTQIGANTSTVYIVACLAFLGLGQGLTMMQMNTHVLNSAPKDLVSRVTPITSSAQQIVVSFGITIVMAMLTNQLSLNDHTLPGMAQAFSHTFFVTLGLAIVGLLLTLFIPNRKTGK